MPTAALRPFIALDEPLTIATHVDPRQTPGEYGTLLGGLHTSPALIAHQAGSPACK